MLREGAVGPALRGEKEKGIEGALDYWTSCSPAPSSHVTYTPQGAVLPSIGK